MILREEYIIDPTGGIYHKRITSQTVFIIRFLFYYQTLTLNVTRY